MRDITEKKGTQDDDQNGRRNGRRESKVGPRFLFVVPSVSSLFQCREIKPGHWCAFQPVYRCIPLAKRPSEMYKGIELNGNFLKNSIEHSIAPLRITRHARQTQFTVVRRDGRAGSNKSHAALNGRSVSAGFAVSSAGHGGAARTSSAFSARGGSGGGGGGAAAFRHAAAARADSANNADLVRWEGN